MAAITKETEGPPLPRRILAVYALLVLGVMVEMFVLIQQGTLAAVGAWLAPLKFVGIATFFAAISVALRTIIPMIRARGAAVAALVSSKNSS